jgi:hypothetical protein
MSSANFKDKMVFMLSWAYSFGAQQDFSSASFEAIFLVDGTSIEGFAVKKSDGLM